TSSSSSSSRSSNLELSSISSSSSSRLSTDDIKKVDDLQERPEEEEDNKESEEEEQQEVKEEKEVEEEEPQEEEEEEVPLKVKQELVDCLNEFVLTNRGGNGPTFSSFPIIMKIPVNETQPRSDIENIVSQCLGISTIYHHDTNTEENQESAEEYLTVGFTTKNELDDFIYKLYQEQMTFELDYSKFISHPGILFIKNLSSNLMSETDHFDSITINEETTPKHKLFEFLMDNCTFKSSEEVKIFNNDNNNASTTPLSAFAIVKFSNHLDVDILIKKYNKYIPNIFNNNTSVPLFLNKYLNRKERFVPPSSSSSSSSSSTTAATSMSSMSTSNNGNNSKSNDNCNLIIVENLLNFKPQPYFTRMDFERFINKFKNFGNVIDSIYFPLVDKGVNLDDIKIFDYGYIRFKQPNPNLMENTLRILYYLNGLSWEEFINLDVNNLPPLLSIITEENTDKEEEEEKEEDTEEKAEEGEEKKTEGSEETNNRKLSITIAQHKHNHNLFAQANSFYLSLSKNSSLGVSFPNPMFTINQFSRNLNYQETNIYVNNLPIVFNNDDVTWEKFWGQFGKIKSAKIIKPQFYHENEDENKSGKIGFVFYQTFKMAIGAILMTNNKVVNVDHFNPIIIQSSFAIQKSNTNKDLKPHLSQQQHQQLQQQQQQSQNPHQQSHVHHPHQQIPNHQVN
ncbi:hypothetical protein G210_4932, partial [Candida maltosa Xu316]